MSLLIILSVLRVIETSAQNHTLCAPRSLRSDTTLGSTQDEDQRQTDVDVECKLHSSLYARGDL